MKRYHIHIQGRVQGVGFRPFIYREAAKKDLKGWVSNTKDGVHIEIIIEEKEEIEEFCDHIRKKCPEQARIEKLKYWEVPFWISETFEIRISSDSGVTDLSLTPDFAICQACKEELFDPENKRFLYPFITCTNCGPRYSIIQEVPYDRNLTTMEPFNMCHSCAEEYADPSDRRFFSQTNSCSECPIELSLYDSRGNKIELDQTAVISFVSKAILEGKIVAIKGIGGFLLMADATSASAIENLRQRKRRPTKPFAVMYPGISEAEKDVTGHDSVRKMWESPESPVILCMVKDLLRSGIKKDLVAPGLNRLGVMMPYAPLFLLLLDAIKKPLIATSGNITESPIIYNDREAMDSLSGIADYLLIHNREILIPQDDSVIQYSLYHRQKIIIRRSRGMAPAFSMIQRLSEYNEPLLAMGAMLKSTFGIYHQDRIFISQYLGNTETLDAQENYEKVINHLSRVLDFQPSTILVDMHPDYPPTLMGEKRAHELKIPIIPVQHHEAHAFAVLAENSLLNAHNILCVVWDGTGLGHDHQIWGGEFFRYGNYSMERIAHWNYFNHLAGDRMALEPRLSLLSLVSGDPGMLDLIRHKFKKNELYNYLKILSNRPLKTSSIGRLFDAVASLLNISDQNTYEGEAAMYLEAEATEVYKNDPEFNQYYELPEEEWDILNGYKLISTIAQDLMRGILDRREIALKFHVSMVKFIERIAKRHQLSQLAFSGGVFQNGLLVDLIHRDLTPEFSLYFHRELSPNDENISYGQLMKYYVSQKMVLSLNDMSQENF